MTMIHKIRKPCALKTTSANHPSIIENIQQGEEGFNFYIKYFCLNLQSNVHLSRSNSPESFKKSFFASDSRTSDKGLPQILNSLFITIVSYVFHVQILITEKGRKNIQQNIDVKFCYFILLSSMINLIICVALVYIVVLSVRSFNIKKNLFEVIVELVCTFYLYIISA